MLNGFRALLLIVLLMPSALLAQTSTLAATPPMGWNSWNHFAGELPIRMFAPLPTPWSPPG